MKFKHLVLFLMLAIPTMLLAQDPTTPGAWIARFSEMITTFPGVFLGLVLLTPPVIGFLNIQKKVYKYLVTGGIGLALILLATFLSYGFLHGAKWYAVVLAYALIVGGQIAGYAIPFLKPIWDAIENKFNIWKPAPVE